MSYSEGGVQIVPPLGNQKVASCYSNALVTPHLRRNDSGGHCYEEKLFGRREEVN